MDTLEKWRKRPLAWLLLIGIFALLLNYSALYAAGETLVRGAIVATAGTAQASGLTMRSTVGQPVTGVRASGGTSLCSGAACPTASLPPDKPDLTKKNWLPLVGASPTNR